MVPLADPTVAIAGLLLDHTPPPGEQVKGSHEPGQTGKIPIIGPGLGVTDTTTDVVQVVASEVYTIVSVPIARPVTTPAVVTVAFIPGVVLNVPGTVASDSVTEVPIHRINGPVIGDGGA